MQITFHLKAKNSSGQQDLIIDPNVPEDRPDEVAITLVGTYEGEDIQIDFDSINKQTLKNNLRSLIEVL